MGSFRKAMNEEINDGSKSRPVFLCSEHWFLLCFNPRKNGKNRAKFGQRAQEVFCEPEFRGKLLLAIGSLPPDKKNREFSNKPRAQILYCTDTKRLGRFI